MGMADIAEVLWNDFLNITLPTQPGMIATALFFPTVRVDAALQFATSDRLRPAAGRLKNFRQLHSKTPGHPEIGYSQALKPPPARLDKVWRTPSGGDSGTYIGGAV